MRLWSYQLLPFLPNKFIIAQWRELIAIKRQWEKGTLKHGLVKYIIDYNKLYFLVYTYRIKVELDNRNINYQNKYFTEIYDFCSNEKTTEFKKHEMNYPEHNERYLKQCLYNLQEKWDRGIISDEEWQLLYPRFKEFIDL